MKTYETVCGLEVHTELATNTKIFCACTTAFGGEANAHCCEVCTGMPGALPTLNKKVVDFAVRTGLALHCTVSLYSQFDRKNYFYPDLPKAYQISQLYLPICRDGYVEIHDSVHGGTKRVRIREIHMEEDAGKLLHQNGKALINYNRAGVPLLEIVSEPDLANGAEAAEYTEKLREILQFIGVSDGKMQEGSLRADVNVSVREAGSTTLGTRCEMKNLSSFKAIKAAVDTEAKRQIAVLEQGGTVTQQTRRWDEKKNASFLLREKEEANDYKYFPEPDLPPLILTDEYVEAVRRSLPELPAEKRSRYVKMGLSAYDASVLCSEPAYAALFEQTLALTDAPKATANWIMGEVMMLQKEKNGTLTPQQLSAVIHLVQQRKITRESGKAALLEAYVNGTDPADYIRQNGLELLQDTAVARTVCRAVIAANEKAVAEYKNGKAKAFNYLLGQCMKQLKGKASPNDIKALLEQFLQE